MTSPASEPAGPRTDQTPPRGPVSATPPSEASAPALPPDIAALSYEQARDQLVDVVRRLESGQGGLEESIALWERGEALARRCQQWLDGARTRLDAAVSARTGAES